MIAFLSKMFYNTLDCMIMYTSDFVPKNGNKTL